jgi:hypothetical protein
MSVPLNQQRLLRDFVEAIKTDKARGLAVSGADLLCAVEQRLGALPVDLRALFSAFSIPAVRRRGRPANNPAREDFGMEDLDQLYSKLVRQFQAEARSLSASDRTTPSERAYRKLAEELSDVFGNIDWFALRNKHSGWKTGRFHSPEGFVDSEDFNAEIERQFPAHK